MKYNNIVHNGIDNQGFYKITDTSLKGGNCNSERIVCIHRGIYHEFGLLSLYREIVDTVRKLNHTLI